MTHYLPDVADLGRWQRTACGLCVRFLTIDHSPEPECVVCQAWLAANERCMPVVVSPLPVRGRA